MAFVVRSIPRAAVRLVRPTLARRALSAYFTPSHEYAKVDGDMATFGITAHAASELGDIVYVDLPEVGAEVTKGENFATVESVKAASDVYAPVSGVVTEVNDKLEGTPNLVNESALEDGWFIKVKMADSAEATLAELMDDKAYAAHIQKD